MSDECLRAECRPLQGERIGGKLPTGLPMRVRAGLATVILGVTLKLSLPDFIALQRLDDDALRKRLRLPASCEPVVAATRKRSRGRITVLVTCGDHPAAEPTMR